MWDKTRSSPSVISADAPSHTDANLTAAVYHGMMDGAHEVEQRMARTRRSESQNMTVIITTESA